MKYFILTCIMLLANISYGVEVKATGSVKVTIIRADEPYTPNTIVYTAEGPTLQVVF